jgi:hypothetical protein
MWPLACLNAPVPAPPLLNMRTVATAESCSSSTGAGATRELIVRRRTPAARPERLGQTEPWLGQFGDGLLVGANRFLEPVAERRADHAHALDDQTRARG